MACVGLVSFPTPTGFSPKGWWDLSWSVPRAGRDWGSVCVPSTRPILRQVNCGRCPLPWWSEALLFEVSLIITPPNNSQKKLFFPL